MPQSVLDLPEPLLHRLFVWGDQGVRSRRAALEVLPDAPGSLRSSPVLEGLARELDRVPNAAIDHSFSDAPDRLLALAVRRDAFESTLAVLAKLCQQARLVLFDPERERIVVPSGR